MPTRTSSFGVGRRESHDSSGFYARALVSVEESRDRVVSLAPDLNTVFVQSSEHMEQLPDSCVALMVTSPPCHLGKDYDSDGSFDDFLDLLERVFREIDPEDALTNPDGLRTVTQGLRKGFGRCDACGRRCCRCCYFR